MSTWFTNRFLGSYGLSCGSGVSGYRDKRACFGILEIHVDVAIGITRLLERFPRIGQPSVWSNAANSTWRKLLKWSPWKLSVSEMQIRPCKVCTSICRACCEHNEGVS